MHLGNKKYFHEQNYELNIRFACTHTLYYIRSGTVFQITTHNLIGLQLIF